MYPISVINRNGAPIRHWTARVIGAFGFGLVLCANAAASDVERGQELAIKWCNACHSVGTDEPRQEDAGPLFTELAKRDADYLDMAISRPHDFMPRFPQLNDSDRADLVAYIRSL